MRRPTVVDAHTGVSSWTDTMRGMGGFPKTAWNRIDIRQGKAAIRRALGVKATQTLTVIRRLRTLEGEPVCLMTNYLPTALVPGLEVTGFESESLYEVLQDRYGLYLAYADEEVTARDATAAEQKAFAVEDQAMLEIRRTTFDAADRPIEYAILSAPSRRYTYRVRIYATQ